MRLPHFGRSSADAEDFRFEGPCLCIRTSVVWFDELSGSWILLNELYDVIEKFEKNPRARITN